MAIPANAYTFDEEMDPKDEVDFIAHGSVGAKPLLGPGEAIASFSLALPSESVALGLTIANDDGREPVKINDDKSVRFWLNVDEAYQANAAFNSVTKLPVELTVITDSIPARTRQRTLVVKVAQQ